MAAARGMLESASARMPEWFGRLPHTDCAIEAVPDFLAEDSPGAYYVPPAPDGSRIGTYFVNTNNPHEKARYESASIAFHEAIPGHHLQLTIASELSRPAPLPAVLRWPTRPTARGGGCIPSGWPMRWGCTRGDLDRIGMLSADSSAVVPPGRRHRDARHGLVPGPGDRVHGNAHPDVGGARSRSRSIATLACPARRWPTRSGSGRSSGCATPPAPPSVPSFDIKGFHDTVLGSGSVGLPVAQRGGRGLDRDSADRRFTASLGGSRAFPSLGGPHAPFDRGTEAVPPAPTGPMPGAGAAGLAGRSRRSAGRPCTVVGPRPGGRLHYLDAPASRPPPRRLPRRRLPAQRPPSTTTAGSTSVPAPTAAPCGWATAPPTTYQHVIWIWMENHTWPQVLGDRAAGTLRGRPWPPCAPPGTNDHNVGSPSLPNYIGATSGATQGITDDGSPASHPLTVDNLFRQVRAAGGTERSYEEDMAQPCQLASEWRIRRQTQPRRLLPRTGR